MSGAVDEDVANTVMDGRETLGAMLRTAQKHLQKVFILFVIALMGTIYFLRAFGWARLKRDLLAQAPDADIIAVTPFDVILLQIKIGLVVGVLVALPVLVYYSRDALKERGIWPRGVPRWKLALAALTSVLLFLSGVAYGYLLFFPIVFDFLSSNAVQAGLQPNYSIVKWVQFVFLLSLSFGLAAQLPLAMSGLSLSGIVRYETFRDYWKHAIVGLYALGALFTPPDPLTQLMWATPLVMLYAFSLSLTKFLVNAQRAGERIGTWNVLRDRWNIIAGIGFLAGTATFLGGRMVLAGALDSYLSELGAVPYVGDYLNQKIPAGLASDTLFGLDAILGLLLVGVVVALLTGGAVLVYLMFRALDELLAREGIAVGPAPASAGDPSNIELLDLDAGGVRSAPIEAFADMSEDRALALASAALNDEDDEKAQAILDRFDEAQALSEATPVEAGATAAAANDVKADGTLSDPSQNEDDVGGDGNVFSRTGAGMLSAFTEEGVDEDDIGGYYYDLAFIASSLTSKAFYLIAVFMTVLAVVFSYLYTGGIGRLKEQFVANLPDQVVAEQVNIVTLHPVEALIFEIKVATIAGAVATLPVLLYFAWPALKERGFAHGDRRVLAVWGGSLFATLVLGSAVGFLYVAPSVISWLANDAIAAHMYISYRINNFGWLVFFTTVGVGLLFCIPVTMLLFHAGGLVPYRTMRRRWREVTITVFALGALLSPRGVFMMFLLGIPVMAMYAIGLVILWATTLGGRRGGGGRPAGGDDPITGTSVTGAGSNVGRERRAAFTSKRLGGLLPTTGAVSSRQLRAVAVALLAVGVATAAFGVGPLSGLDGSLGSDDWFGGGGDVVGPNAPDDETPSQSPGSEDTSTNAGGGGESDSTTNTAGESSETSSPGTAGRTASPAIGGGGADAISPSSATDGGARVQDDGTPMRSATSPSASNPTATESNTNSQTSQATATSSPTGSDSPTSSATPSNSDTPTNEPTPTDSTTPTAQPSPTDSPSSTPSSTATPTPSPTSTPTPTPTPDPILPINPLDGLLSIVSDSVSLF